MFAPNHVQLIWRKMPEKKEEKQPSSNGTFNTSAFMKHGIFSQRDAEVDVKGSVLAEFFTDGAETVWKVRGLVADEIARSAESSEMYKKADAVVKALSTDNDSEITKGVQKLLGTGSDVHTDVVKRQEHLIYGSISPMVTKQMAVRIAEVAPAEFYEITNKILELTGLGQIAGKSKPSGKEQT